MLGASALATISDPAGEGKRARDDATSRERGDEINQRDRRFLGGIDALYQHQSKPFGVSLLSTAGFQYRIDTPRACSPPPFSVISWTGPRTST